MQPAWLKHINFAVIVNLGFSCGNVRRPSDLSVCHFHIFYFFFRTIECPVSKLITNVILWIIKIRLQRWAPWYLICRSIFSFFCTHLYYFMTSHKIFQKCSSRSGRNVVTFYINSKFNIGALVSDWQRHFRRFPQNHFVWSYKTCQKIFHYGFCRSVVTFSVHSKSKMVTLTSYWLRHFRFLTWTTTCKVTRLTRTVPLGVL